VPYLKELLLENHSSNANLSDGRSIEEDCFRNQDDKSTDDLDEGTDGRDTSTDDGETLQEDGTLQPMQAETNAFTDEELRPFQCPVNGYTKADKTFPVTGKKIAFFMFDFSDPDKRTAEQMIRCLLLQLAAQNSSAYTKVRELHVKQQSIPGFFVVAMATWKVLFHNVLCALEPFSWYFVIDGLDECIDFTTLLDILAIETAESFQYWVLTSQDDYRLGAVSELRRNTIYLEGEELREDISSYVSARLKADPGLRVYAPERKSMIQEAVMEKSHEM
jgi:hypothetical protein